MRKVMIGFIGLVVFFGFAVSTAHSWGSLTHVYMAQHLKRQAGPLSLDEIYGIVSPDIFNYMFTPPYIYYRDHLHDGTHNQFMHLWDAVEKGYEKPISWGFVAHNDVWGSDSTAHHNSRTLFPNEGYVITKATMLHNMLMTIPEYAALGLPYEVSVEVSHNIVEAAGDVIIMRADPSLGGQLVKGAMRPNQVFSDLLIEAYAPGLAQFSSMTPFVLDYQSAVQIIWGAEAEFRAYMVAYGTLFQQEEAVVIEGIVLDFENLAYSYLTALGIELPSGTDLKPLIRAALQMSFAIMEQDYLPEILSTIDYVDYQMKAYKIGQKTK